MRRIARRQHESCEDAHKDQCLITGSASSLYEDDGYHTVARDKEVGQEQRPTTDDLG